MGTARADDPMLTCRLPGLESRSPLRVVLETQLQLSPESQLVRTAKQHPTLVFTAVKYASDLLAGLGVEVVEIAADGKGRPDVLAVLQALAKRGITRVLVEGGPTLHASFLARGLADLIYLYRAPLLIGAGGKPAISPVAQSTLDAAPRLRLVERTALGPDVLESFAVEG
jgi:diaminohydroxyphosphoribosylaminopyrimidine deaminase/5-amino-6-(5-phosphoribosylamino)uracil reductase